MATTVTKVIDPDMGSGYDYDSLYDWEAAQQGDLTGVRDEIAVAKCRCTGGTADTTVVTIDGWTTSAAQYIKVWTDPSENYRHNGTYQTGNKYRIAGYGAAHGLSDYEDNIRIYGIQIYHDNTAVDDKWGILIDSVGGATPNSCHIEVADCVLRGNGNLSWYDIGVRAYGRGRWYFYNNVIYDWGRSGTVSYAGITMISAASGEEYFVFNNTFHNNYCGIYCDPGSDVSAKNNLIKSSNTAASGTFVAGSGYNATDNASMGYTVTGGATADRISQTFTFVNEGADDFHLQASDAGALGFGLNLYNDANYPFQTDIDGQDRGGAAAAWDIGADEYVAAVVFLAHIFLKQYKARRD